ncbi:receptor accessory protein 4 [Lunasporangiospora selenospora]|uniref:Protein YOP1 n=1 Tax=Lunasporangiospora selenospora TaxID=979761 RepID=A0A9P6KBB6_9FUNG|nr:receptor accessory protein 4 [Lunasporangiospora selenospora]
MPYASFKAVNSGDSRRLMAWLMYWVVMGLFTAAEFVLDMFIFWLPFYYEIKMLVVLWMMLPQTQGSIFLYESFVEPYLLKHEDEIDQALKDAQKQAMAAGMKYVKQAFQMLQDLAFDFYRKVCIAEISGKSQGETSLNAASFADSGRDPAGMQTDRQASGEPSAPGQRQDPNNAHSYLAWAYHMVSPQLSAVATMASQSMSRQAPGMPFPQLQQPQGHQLHVSSSSSPAPVSRASLAQGQVTSDYSNSPSIQPYSMSPGYAGISPEEQAQLDRLSSRLNRAGQSTGVVDMNQGSNMRYRKISLYEDDSDSGTGVSSNDSGDIVMVEDYKDRGAEAQPQPPVISSTNAGHVSENSWSSLVSGFRRRPATPSS